MNSDLRRLLTRTAELSLEYLDWADRRPVTSAVSMEELLTELDEQLPDDPVDAMEVVETLARDVDRGLVVTNAGRYFGFVEGGVLPAALAADWLTATWDQNPCFHALSPAAAAAEEVCRRWLCGVLGLPPTASAGFTTGGQMANFTGLAAARHQVLAEAGWDVHADGLIGAPPVTVIVGEQRHVTIDRALRFLGLGERRIRVVPADEQGRMAAGELRHALGEGPTIVCAQAGNVNTGAFDPLQEIGEATRAQGAWLHIDGAFGLWAAAAPARRHLTEGLALADSWATDAHKWLNVPYDCGVVFCAHPDSHRAAMTLSAAYLARTGGRDGGDWTPEGSRRARVFPVLAALRSLGRSGIAEMVERSCIQAQRFADILAADDAVTVLNDIVLNQVLVRIGDDDDATRDVAAAVQEQGATWLGTTTWRGDVAIRISVSDHATDDADITAAAAAVLQHIRH
ncbi:MAG: pyridoxal phosphate-dependent decarboxylase family protein [Nocardioidaceae bacterium]